MTRLFFTFSLVLVLGHVLSVQGVWRAIQDTDLIYDRDYFYAYKVGDDLRIILTPREDLYLSFLSRRPDELPRGEIPEGMMVPGNKVWLRPSMCTVNDDGVVQIVGNSCHFTRNSSQVPLPEETWPMYWYDTYHHTKGDDYINMRRPEVILLNVMPLDLRHQSLTLGFRSMSQENEHLKLAIDISLFQLDYIHSIVQTPSERNEGAYDPDYNQRKPVLMHRAHFRGPRQHQL